MNKIITHLDLDLASSNEYKIINAQQLDNNTRRLEVNLFHEGKIYDISNVMKIELQGYRGDGKTIKTSLSHNGNTIIVDFDNSILGAKGNCKLKIVVYGNNDEILSSFPFTVKVDANVYETNGTIAEPISPETDREKAENERVKNENERVKNENERVLNFEKMKKDYEDFKQNSGSSTTINKNIKTLGKCALWYRDYNSWGKSIEECARRISKFDLIVGGGELHGDNANSSESAKEQIKIIQRARELNPGIKFFYYFSIASWRNDNGYEHILKPGGIWDEDETQHTGIVRIYNKWEHFQHIERALHMGGKQTDQKELVETYTWTDSDGKSHTENKYIYLWEGGIPFDGVFFDDAGMDSTQGILNQCYKNTRDKSKCLCDFSHARNLSCFVNQLNADGWYSSDVSNANPDGLPSAVNENDFLLVESCHTQVGDSSGYPLWRNINNVKSVYDYYKNYYNKVKAKVVVNDYTGINMTNTERDILRTYCIFSCIAVGAHYLDYNGDLDWELPDEVKLFKKTEDEILDNVILPNDVFKLELNGHVLQISRPSTLTQGVKCNITGLKHVNISIDGNDFLNSYKTSPVLDKESDERISEMESVIDEITSSSKKTSSVYHRMLIDDWSKEYNYTNYVTSKWFSQLISLVEKEFTISSQDTNSKSLNCVRKTNNQVSKEILLDANKVLGHTIEIGLKVKNIAQYQFGFACLDTWNSAFENNSNLSTLYPDDNIWIARIKMPDAYESDTISIKLVMNGSVGDVFNFENLYIIDINEFEDDITKSWYTNLISNISSYYSFNDMTPAYSINTIENDGFTITWDKDSLYSAWSGIAWDIPDGTFKLGHKYEIGCESFETNLQDGDTSIAFRVNVYGSPGNEYWFPNTYIGTSEIYKEQKNCYMFTMNESVGIGNGNGRVSFVSITSTNKNNSNQNITATVKGLYIYDVDEEGIVFRGENPSNSFLQICRVTPETLANDKNLIGNCLYFVNNGSVFITDFTGNRIDIDTFGEIEEIELGANITE